MMDINLDKQPGDIKDEIANYNAFLDSRIKDLGELALLKTELMAIIESNDAGKINYLIPSDKINSVVNIITKVNQLAKIDTEQDLSLKIKNMTQQETAIFLKESLLNIKEAILKISREREEQTTNLINLSDKTIQEAILTHQDELNKLGTTDSVEKTKLENEIIELNAMNKTINSERLNLLSGKY